MVLVPSFGLLEVSLGENSRQNGKRGDAHRGADEDAAAGIFAAALAEQSACVEDQGEDESEDEREAAMLLRAVRIVDAVRGCGRVPKSNSRPTRKRKKITPS